MQRLIEISNELKALGYTESANKIIKISQENEVFFINDKYQAPLPPVYIPGDQVSEILNTVAQKITDYLLNEGANTSVQDLPKVISGIIREKLEPMMSKGHGAITYRDLEKENDKLKKRLSDLS